MTTWFNKARFGMFIHWDHASQTGLELSWPLVGGVFSLPYCQNVSVEEYHATAKTFNPQLYNPQEWAQQAKRLNMQYVIFTTKHHNGYAMFHTSHSQFSVQSSPYGKDIVREFTDAVRSEGLRIGLYFSLTTGCGFCSLGEFVWKPLDTWHSIDSS